MLNVKFEFQETFKTWQKTGVDNIYDNYGEDMHLYLDQ